MPGIVISKEELKGLMSKVLETYRAEGGNEQNWNSNPENYSSLAGAIKSKTSKEIGKHFLRNAYNDFLKNSDTETVLRPSNVDTLYEFAFGMNRDEYLLGNAGKGFMQKVTIICAGSSIPDLDANQKAEFSDYTRTDINSCSFEEVMEKAEDKNQVVYFYIDEAFLKNRKGVIWLLRLFQHNSYRLWVDLGVKFIFEKSLVTASEENIEEPRFNLVTDIGRLTIHRYWKTVYEKIRALLDVASGNDDSDPFGLCDYEEIIGPKFYITLLALAEVKSKSWVSDKAELYKHNTVNSFQPFFKVTKGLKIENFIELYKQSKSLASNPQHPSPLVFSFYCVIGYNGYFDLTQKEEMIRYFCQFSRTLDSHDIVRIFTVAASKQKDSFLKPVLNDHQKRLLYQYIHTNVSSGVGTYVLLYDHSLEPSNHILFYQDYVIRLQKYNTSVKDPLDNIDKAIVGDEKIEADAHKMLYLAYPEKLNGINQMISVDDSSDILRFCQDFRNRISVLENERKGYQLMRVTKDNYDIIMGLLDFDGETSQALINESDEIIKKANYEVEIGNEL